MNKDDLLAKFKRQPVTTSAQKPVTATVTSKVTDTVTPKATVKAEPVPKKGLTGGLSASLKAARSQAAATPKVKTPKVKTAMQTLAASNTKVAQEVELKKTAIKDTIEIPTTILERCEGLDKIEGLEVDSLLGTLASTYEALVLDEPDLPKLLQKIASNLHQYEELHYLLNPDQIGLLFKGLMKVKNVQIKTTKAKVSAKSNIQQVENEGGLDLM